MTQPGQSGRTSAAPEPKVAPGPGGEPQRPVDAGTTDGGTTGGDAGQADGGAGSTTLVQTFKAVGSALFGVRSSKGHQTDIARLNPIHVILAGLLAVAVFIGLLIFFARMMLRASGAA